MDGLKDRRSWRDGAPHVLKLTSHIHKRLFFSLSASVARYPLALPPSPSHDRSAPLNCGSNLVKSNSASAREGIMVAQTLFGLSCFKSGLHVNLVVMIFLWICAINLLLRPWMIAATFVGLAGDKILLRNSLGWDEYRLHLKLR